MGGLAYTPTAAEQVLSTAMATTWISFAKKANPPLRYENNVVLALPLRVA
jgi:hypothetical protein